MKDKINRIYIGNSLDVLKQFPDECVDMCITSPPYWGLRDYGREDEVGKEPTIELYIEHLIEIFNEVKRVLKKSGTCWVNIGDTYSRGGTGGHPKSLCQIPERLSIAMTDNGWIKRNTIIWHKPNAMPSSAKDRFTVDFEYLYFFTKSTKYWFKQQLEPYVEPMNRWGGTNLVADGISTWDAGTQQSTYRDRSMRPNPDGRNKRTVWSINTKPYKDAHFAVYPQELLRVPIDAGCPPEGIVLDPFVGSGTTCIEAIRQEKKYIGIDINPEYEQLIENRKRNLLKE